MKKQTIKLLYFVITISFIIGCISICDSSSYSEEPDFHLYYGLTSVTHSDNYIIINFNNESNGIFDNFFTKAIAQLIEKIPNQDNMTGWNPSKSYPIKNIALGMSFNEFHEPLSVQILMYLPSSKDKLSKIASGNFTSDTVWSAITGVPEKTDKESHSSATSENEMKAEKSSVEGVYLTENIAVAVLPESDILILGLTPEDVSDVTGRIKNKKFIEITKNFDEEDFCLFQLTVKDMLTPDTEPLQIKAEYALSKQPYGFDIKQYSNLYELFPGIEKKLPVHGTIPLFGRGQPYLFAHMALETEILESLMKLSGFSWEYFVEILYESFNEYGIAAEDIRNLISNSFSIVSGIDANLIDGKIPGFYICFGGSNNSAGKFIKAVENYSGEEGLLKSIEIPGWDAVLTTSEHIPVSITVGQKGDNLLVGLIDPESLSDRPELNEKMKGIISESGNVAYSYMDFELFWSELKNQFLNDGFMTSLIKAGLSQNVFNAIMNLIDTAPPIKSLTSKSKTFNMSVTQIEINEENEPFITAFVELIHQLMQDQLKDDSSLYDEENESSDLDEDDKK